MDNVGSRPSPGVDHVHLIAHGSPDPRHAETVRRLARRVTGLTGTPVSVSFLDHDEPRAYDALLPPLRPTLALHAEHSLVLPLLLTGGVHWQRDVPPMIGHQGTHRRLLPALAPAVFAGAVAELIAEQPTASRVILASAGSSQPHAAARFAALAADVAEILRALGRPTEVLVALSPADVAGLGPDDIVIPVLIADGVFADRIRAAASVAGATTTPVVGDTWAGAHAVAAALSATPFPAPHRECQAPSDP